MKNSQPYFNKALSLESTEKTRNIHKSKNKLLALKATYPKAFGRIILDYDRKYLCTKPSFNLLHSSYSDLVYRLNNSREVERTYSERKVIEQINRHSTKQIITSPWIGSSCIDIFIPNVKSDFNNATRTMRGLALEIDGDSHNYENKMRKDELKGLELSLIGIGTSSILNWEINKPTTNSIFHNLSSLKKLDSRERKRMWRNIYILTLAIQLSESDFFSIFEPQHKELHNERAS